MRSPTTTGMYCGREHGADVATAQDMSVNTNRKPMTTANAPAMAPPMARSRRLPLTQRARNSGARPAIRPTSPFAMLQFQRGQGALAVELVADRVADEAR